MHRGSEVEDVTHQVHHRVGPSQDLVHGGPQREGPRAGFGGGEVAGVEVLVEGGVDLGHRLLGGAQLAGAGCLAERDERDLQGPVGGSSPGRALGGERGAAWLWAGAPRGGWSGRQHETNQKAESAQHLGYPRAMRCTVCGIIAHLLLWGGAAWAAEGDGVRLVVHGPAVPWTQITYEVAHRHGGVTARVTKAWPEGFGRREEVGLVPAEELTDLLADIEAVVPLWPKGRRSTRYRARYTLIVDRAGQRRSWVVHDPNLGEANAPSKIMALIGAVIGENTRPVRFQDALLLPDESGWLKVDADVVSAVRVDGVLVADHTPLQGLRLPVGAHKIRLSPLDGRAPRVYPIKIEMKKTTALVVELR